MSKSSFKKLLDVFVNIFLFPSVDNWVYLQILSFVTSAVYMVAWCIKNQVHLLGFSMCLEDVGHGKLILLFISHNCSKKLRGKYMMLHVVGNTTFSEDFVVKKTIKKKFRLHTAVVLFPSRI